jgi:hypothetical protein
MKWLTYAIEPYEVIMTPSKAVECGDAISAVPHFAKYK